MINLHIEAKNVADLRSQLSELLAGIEAAAPASLLLTGHEVPSTQTDVNPAAEAAESTQPDVTPTEPVKTFKLEEVRTAANAYRDKHGIEKLREIFSKYGGEKLKDIPESNYAALMEEIA